MQVFIFLAGIVIGTWNGNWFPSRRAEHRAHPDVEQATTLAAGKMLRGGLRKIDPLATNDVIIVLNEMRGPKAVSNLVAAIAWPRLRLAAISGYRRRDRFDQQQDAILTTLPVAATGWSRWPDYKRETPPRGYAYVDFLPVPTVTGRVYAVHLKSNYGARKEVDKKLNFAKRHHAGEALLKNERLFYGKPRRPVLVAGDFNTDPWRAEFAAETIFADFGAAGFRNALALLPADKRGTHPSKWHGDSALDHILMRGFEPVSVPFLVPSNDLSDHQAVFVLLRLPEGCDFLK